MKTLCLSVMSSCAFIFTSSIAAAQDPAPPAQQPATTTPADPAAPAATPAAQPDAPPDEGHFRWGISPMGGTFFPGPTTIAFGLEVRLGYAINQTVTAFGSIGSVAGIGFGGDFTQNGASASVSAVSYWYLGGNIDALLAGPLFVGAGVAFGKAGWGVVSQSASSAGGAQEVIAAGGWTPSGDLRLGLMFGKLNEKTGKRSGFSLALDVRMLVAPDSVETKQEVNASGASQSVTKETTAVGYSPMLLLGYELR